MTSLGIIFLYQQSGLSVIWSVNATVLGAHTPSRKYTRMLVSSLWMHAGLRISSFADIELPEYQHPKRARITSFHPLDRIVFTWKPRGTDKQSFTLRSVSFASPFLAFWLCMQVNFALCSLLLSVLILIADFSTTHFSFLVISSGRWKITVEINAVRGGSRNFFSQTPSQHANAPKWNHFAIFTYYSNKTMQCKFV